MTPPEDTSVLEESENNNLMEGRYSLVSQIKGSIGGTKIELGARGACRYCGVTNGRYRKVAHTFPVALGNRWVTSKDECDACNERFSKYEDALVKALGSILTLSGFKGRDGKIRQTGRSSGPVVLRRDDNGDQPHIQVQVNGESFGGGWAMNPSTGMIILPVPVPNEPFVPRFAYKALVKMAIALMPAEELVHYTKLLRWIQEVDDKEPFTFLEVGLSFAVVGQAMPLVAATLLRRVDPTDVVPHMIFAFCAGPICFQIDLMSDSLEDHIPPVFTPVLKALHTVILADDDGNSPITIEYPLLGTLNWASDKSAPPPIEKIKLHINTRTNSARFEPILRR